MKDVSGVNHPNFSVAELEKAKQTIANVGVLYLSPKVKAQDRIEIISAIQLAAQKGSEIRFTIDDSTLKRPQEDIDGYAPFPKVTVKGLSAEITGIQLIFDNPN